MSPTGPAPRPAPAPAALPARTRWRLLETWDGEPGFNMALDEALLHAASDVPVLRFYTWRPDAVSLGWFQRWAELAPLVAGRVAVRRPTGGGAIHHAEELTFAIAAPAGHPLYRGDVRGSYLRVHGALARALLALGVRAAPRGNEVPRSEVPGSAMCFHASSDVDLLWDGAKGVGSAQRRVRGRVLHHGSIKLGTTELEGPIATLRAHAPGLQPEELAARLREPLGELLGAELAPDEPTADELRHARRRAAHFRSPELLRRR